MNTKTATHTPGDLQDFVAEIFASLVRKDQRATNSYYLQGLMLEGRRKSMQPLAMCLGIDHQRLQPVCLHLTLAGQTGQENPGYQGNFPDPPGCLGCR